MTTVASTSALRAFPTVRGELGRAAYVQSASIDFHTRHADDCV